MKCFVEKLNRKESLKPLLRNASLSLVLTCQNESYYMELKNNRFSWRRMKGEDNPDIWLTGDMTSISLVMEGEVLLREAKKNGSIQLEGSLRKILLLESVFFLSHSRSVPHTG
ncbi:MULTISPECIES: SCP2 sterol-binding domain-containing protein [unclassified Niallia]